MIPPSHGRCICAGGPVPGRRLPVALVPAHRRLNRHPGTARRVRPRPEPCFHSRQSAHGGNPVLSFDITHQLTDLLIAIEAAAHHHDDSVARHHDPVLPALAAVFINPPNPAPWLCAEPVPVPDHAWHTQPG